MGALTKRVHADIKSQVRASSRLDELIQAIKNTNIKYFASYIARLNNQKMKKTNAQKKFEECHDRAFLEQYLVRRSGEGLLFVYRANQPEELESGRTVRIVPMESMLCSPHECAVECSKCTTQGNTCNLQYN